MIESDYDPLAKLLDYIYYGFADAIREDIRCLTVIHSQLKQLVDAQPKQPANHRQWDKIENYLDRLEYNLHHFNPNFTNYQLPMVLINERDQLMKRIYQRILTQDAHALTAGETELITSTWLHILANLAHDLKNPISAIMMRIHLFQIVMKSFDVDEDDVFIHHMNYYLQDMQIVTKRMLVQIKKLQTIKQILMRQFRTE